MFFMKYDWSKSRLESTVSFANCWFNWLELLNVPKRGSNYKTLKKKAKEYNIDTSHFNYEYSRTHNGLRILKNKSNKDIFKEQSNIYAKNLKREYISRILNGDYKCEICGISEWNHKQIVLQIHHINGVFNDNRIENLQLLCPNCHSQTDNYRGKNNKRNVKYCLDCGKEINRKSTYCSSCAAKLFHSKVKDRPSKEMLISDFKEIGSFCGIGLKYGVTDNAVRKWFSAYGLPKKSKEMKKYIKNC